MLVAETSVLGYQILLTNILFTIFRFSCTSRPLEGVLLTLEHFPRSCVRYIHLVYGRNK